MARTPDGPFARGVSVTTRMSPIECEKLDAQRRERGGMDRSTYIRWLVSQDGKRIHREKGD